MNLLTWCHLHQQFFVHQTVGASAHTNYLILLVKEQLCLPWSKDGQLWRCPAWLSTTQPNFFQFNIEKSITVTVLANCQMPSWPPVEEARILRRLPKRSSSFFAQFLLQFRGNIEPENGLFRHWPQPARCALYTAIFPGQQQIWNSHPDIIAAMLNCALYLCWHSIYRVLELQERY